MNGMVVIKNNKKLISLIHFIYTKSHQIQSTHKKYNTVLKIYSERLQSKDKLKYINIIQQLYGNKLNLMGIKTLKKLYSSSVHLNTRSKNIYLSKLLIKVFNLELKGKKYFLLMNSSI